MPTCPVFAGAVIICTYTCLEQNIACAGDAETPPSTVYVVAYTDVISNGWDVKVKTCESLVILKCTS